MVTTGVIGSKWKIVGFVDPIPPRMRFVSYLILLGNGFLCLLGIGFQCVIGFRLDIYK